MSRQEVIWVPGSPSKAPIEGSPVQVWTLLTYRDPDVRPVLPFTPVHGVNAFAEDFLHDWNVRPRGTFRYFSRVVGPGEGVWLLLEYPE